MRWVCDMIMWSMQSATGHKPEHSYSAHHNSSSLLVKTHGNVLNTWWLYPVSCACCDSYSPLTTGMLVLCDELYAASSTLRDWCCVLKLKEKENIKCHFPFVRSDDKIFFPICFILMTWCFGRYGVFGFIILLVALWGGKKAQILHCDWLTKHCSLRTTSWLLQYKILLFIQNIPPSLIG